MFSVHTALEEFKNAAISVHFGCMVEKKSDNEMTWLSRRYLF